jgi:tRNA A-37 threonylcarbamoyl transferase component Bud32
MQPGKVLQTWARGLPKRLIWPNKIFCKQATRRVLKRLRDSKAWQEPDLARNRLRNKRVLAAMRLLAQLETSLPEPLRR